MRKRPRSACATDFYFCYSLNCFTYYCFMRDVRTVHDCCNTAVRVESDQSGLSLSFYDGFDLPYFLYLPHNPDKRTPRPFQKTVPINAHCLSST